MSSILHMSQHAQVSASEKDPIAASLNAIAHPPAACPGCYAIRGLPFPQGYTTQHCAACLAAIAASRYPGKLPYVDGPSVPGVPAPWLPRSDDLIALPAVLRPLALTDLLIAHLRGELHISSSQEEEGNSWRIEMARGEWLTLTQWALRWAAEETIWRE